MLYLVIGLSLCFFIQANCELVRDPPKSTVIPFYKVYTPSDIVRDAEFTSTYTQTATALTFGTGTTTSRRLFKLPLLNKNVLYSDADISVVLTIGLESGIRSGDSDPKFFLSDGYNGVGFEMREESTADRCRGIQATMGTTFTSSTTIPGHKHGSLTLPEQFVLTIKPSQRWGSCYNSVDSGAISPVTYTRSVNLAQGLWLEVYREGTNELYVFNYIQVEIHEN